jgi:hypothetical protein
MGTPSANTELFANLLPPSRGNVLGFSQEFQHNNTSNQWEHQELMQNSSYTYYHHQEETSCDSHRSFKTYSTSTCCALYCSIPLSAQLPYTCLSEKYNRAWVMQWFKLQPRKFFTEGIQCLPQYPQGLFLSAPIQLEQSPNVFRLNKPHNFLWSKYMYQRMGPS